MSAASSGWKAWARLTGRASLEKWASTSFLLLQRVIMTTLWVSMAFHLGGLTLWIITVLLIMIDDRYPRTNAAGGREQHYYNNTGIDTIEAFTQAPTTMIFHPGCTSDIGFSMSTGREERAWYHQLRGDAFSWH